MTLSNTVVPQCNTIQSTQNTVTKMPDQFITKDKEDNNSVASMSAIETTITEQPQVWTDCLLCHK